MANLVQAPAPGTHLHLHCGDVLYLVLDVEEARGTAFLRTNIGSGTTRRNEIISLVHTGMAAEGQDWRDIPMYEEKPGRWVLRLALTEPGHFEAKCALRSPDGSLLWPQGSNLHVNVSPAEYCCDNSIYCAFVRQFGPGRFAGVSREPDEDLEHLDREGYVVIPRSGTFRDLIGELDHIFNRLHCRILHLLPINPTPTVYARMGRYGSPYASLDFLGVDPALAEFDKTATPLEQFQELADAVHAHDGKLFIDLAVNHTGWASRIHQEHPEWLKRKPDGEIVSPGAWGVIWGDLTELDYSRKELWKYIAEVFLTWCGRGVDGFRCDAGYMIPVPAWEYIIARVRNHYPDTVFLLEGLGGDPAVTRELLDRANMNWAYSELFQNYSKEAVEGYLRYSAEQSRGNGLMVHYAETHDNNRLAAVSPLYAKMRTGLSALASVNGAFGFANGVEWFAREKIDVHEARSLSWGASPNMTEYIGKLNRILLYHPAFHNGASYRIMENDSSHAVLLKRQGRQGDGTVLAAFNLDCEKEAVIRWQDPEEKGPSRNLTDLITGQSRFLAVERNCCTLTLAPGEVLCLAEETDGFLTEDLRDSHTRLEKQCARFMALSAFCAATGSAVLRKGEDPAELGRRLIDGPEQFVRSLLPEMPVPCIEYHLPEDLTREVPVPPGHFLLVTAPVRFRARMEGDGRDRVQFDGLQDRQGRWFVLFPPMPGEAEGREVRLSGAVLREGKIIRGEGKILCTASDTIWTASHYTAEELHSGRDLTFLQGNGRGGAIHIGTFMPELESRYDALLLANLSTEYPEDRHIMLRRYRIWMSYSAGIQEVGLSCLEGFDQSPSGGGIWHYRIPAGGGKYVSADLMISMDPGKNVCRASLFRKPASGPRDLADREVVTFIFRPDVEDRSFHHATKARSVENFWPSRCRKTIYGMEFAPDPTRILRIASPDMTFMEKIEWLYMVKLRKEEERGLDPYTDLFSPGSFSGSAAGGSILRTAAWIATPMEPKDPEIVPMQPEDFRPAGTVPSERALRSAIRTFIVKRGRHKSVIAGYPWFLDWGRDTLIACRGLLASPEFREDAKQILYQFASFAEKGTIPNVICGADASNRDTSDAPLWLIVAAADCCQKENSFTVLEEKIGRNGETFREELEAVADGYLAGTPNGIAADPESGLVFSPAHFTWMDTNYPAGTPREGYPVEIQALWIAALRFLASLPGAKEIYRKTLSNAEASLLRYFVLPEKGWLSDCLHGTKGTPASQAEPDDALRPNQLFAVTLGAVWDREVREKIIGNCSRLLIPGAIRTLDHAEVQYPLPVIRNGRVLNDPRHPYWGHYQGDEDTFRKCAYHNGTAWTWVFPSYCEALVQVYGANGVPAAKALLSTAEHLFHNGCTGQLPEILDGDLPHTPRGCDAQAWGITEVYRVWKLLHPDNA